MRIIERMLSSDGIATKYIQETSDGFVVEATHINGPQKHTICASTQVGCAIRCGFCASGLRSVGVRYMRSLSADELVAEFVNIAREVNVAGHPKPLHCSFMGEGEPFLNFKACVAAFHTLAGMAWSVPVHLAVATSGIRPDLIRRLGEFTFAAPLGLKVSLHGPTDEVRAKIILVAKPIASIVAAVRSYRDRCGRPVAWNYVMCDGVNDELKHAEQLACLLGSGWVVKFGDLNPVAGSSFRPSPAERVEAFRRVLEAHGITTRRYVTNESGIGSGCGQLSYRYRRMAGSP